MNKYKNYFLVIISFLLINLGTFSVMQYLYDPVTDSGFTVIGIVDDNGMNFGETDISYGGANTNRYQEIIIPWSEENDTSVFFKALNPFANGNYYHVPEFNNDIYYTFSADLQNRLMDSGARIMLAPESLSDINFLDSDLLIPMSNLTDTGGFLYIESSSEEVLNLYDSLQSSGVNLTTDRSNILDKGIFTQLSLLLSADLLGQIILLGILVLIFLVLYSISVYLHSLESVMAIHRQFGLSLRKIMQISVVLLVIIFLVIICVSLPIFSLMRNIPLGNYYTNSLILIFGLDFAILLVVLIVFNIRMRRGRLNESF